MEPSIVKFKRGPLDITIDFKVERTLISHILNKKCCFTNRIVYCDPYEWGKSANFANMS